jgi:hypothetical protein
MFNWAAEQYGILFRGCGSVGIFPKPFRQLLEDCNSNKALKLSRYANRRFLGSVV